MHDYTITGYIHNGDTFCADCGHDDDEGGVIYAGSETDTPQTCADCGCLIETDWTRDCRRYVAEKIAEYVTGFGGDADTLQQWADYASMSADIDGASYIYAEIGGTWSHGTLRTVDLLDAAANCAEAIADLYHDADDLRRLAAEGRDAVQHLEEEDEEEDDIWLLEEITDAIAAALPAPLYYGCTEGDGSDIGVWCSAEMD